MTAINKLQSKIRAAIMPWRMSTEEPPFTLGQLIVMALVLRNGQMTIEDLVAWLVRTFKYYSLEVKRQMEVLKPTDFGYKTTLAGKLRLASQQFSLPVTISQTPLPIRTPILETSIPPAQIYLQRALNLEPEGSFPFLRLPPELRD